MAIDYAEQPISSTPAKVREQLVCALTSTPINADTAYWAPPLVTASQLVQNGNCEQTGHSPSTPGHVLFDEQPDVPYGQRRANAGGPAQRRAAEAAGWAAADDRADRCAGVLLAMR